jgi:hypothetical protein
MQIVDGRYVEIPRSVLEEELQCAVCKGVPRTPVTLKVVRPICAKFSSHIGRWHFVFVSAVFASIVSKLLRALTYHQGSDCWEGQD